MNKLVFSILALCLSFTAMSQNMCTIKGKSSQDKVGEYLYVFYGKQVVDSVAIKPDASFEMQIKAENKLCQFGGKYQRNKMNFVAEAGIVEFDLAQGTSKGGKENQELSKLSAKFDEIVKVYEVTMSEINKEAIDDAAKEEKASALYNTTISNLKLAAIEVIKANPSSQVAGFALESILMYFEQPEEFFEHYNTLSDFAKQYPALEVAYKLAKALESTSEGKMFVDFTIKGGSLDGKDVKFSDYVGKGKYTLVDFWATWCGPCKREIPNLREINKDFGKEITVLSVAVWDKKDATLKFVAQNDMPWNHIVDAQSIPTDIYGIQGIPQIILFAPDGTVVKRNLRGEEIRKTLEEVLKK